MTGCYRRSPSLKSLTAARCSQVERDSPNFYEEDEEEGCGEGYTCRIWHTVHYLKADSWEVSPGCTVAEGIE